METFLVLGVIAWLWWNAHRNFEATGAWSFRRRRASFSWAFLAAIVGSFIGVAGFGTAIAGTLPGAFVGYLLASNAMKSDSDPR